MDAENANQLNREIARLNQRIEEMEAAFCGIVESLTSKRYTLIQEALKIATEQLLPRHAVPLTSAASLAERAVQGQGPHEVDPTA